MTTRWRVRGRDASVMQVAQELALARAYRKKMGQADREARDRDTTARAVGSAIRKAERERMRFGIGCSPARVSGRRKGGVRLRNFETRLGLTHPMRSFVSKSGFSSFHLKFSPRGSGSYRRAQDRGYAKGEVVRAVLYILRETAREIADGGVVSSISKDPDEIASVLAAIEELELAGGRKNANVYTSVVISLPHELDGGREALLEQICAPFAELDLPYVAVLHAPDPEGDQRNYHAHILFSWRPLRITDDGYVFADATHGALNTAEFVKDFRIRAAAAMNEAMAMAGKPRRFTAEKRDRTNGKVIANEEKLTAGQKHERRRRRSIEAGRAEQGWIADRDAVLARVETAAASWLVHDPVSRALEVSALCARDAALVAAHARELASPVVGRAIAAPDHIVAQGRTIDAVSREKHSSIKQVHTSINKPSAPVSGDSDPSSATPVTQGITKDHTARRTPASGVSQPGGARQREIETLAAVYQLQAESRKSQLDLEDILPLERVESLSSARRLAHVGRLVDVPTVDANVLPDGVEIGRSINWRPDLESEVGQPVVEHTATDTRPNVPIIKEAEPSPSVNVHGGGDRTPSAKPGLHGERENPQRASGERRDADIGIEEPAADIEAGKMAAKLARQRADRVLAELSQLEFLPLRPLAQEDDGAEESLTFKLMIAEAAAGDEAIIKAAVEFQHQERYQALFRECFERMLDRLRNDLTIGRATKPIGGKPLRELFLENPRLQAAMAANGQNAHQKAIETVVRNYWAQLTASLPSVEAKSAVDDDAISIEDQLQFRKGRGPKSRG